MWKNDDELAKEMYYKYYEKKERWLGIMPKNEKKLQVLLTIVNLLDEENYNDVSFFDMLLEEISEAEILI